MEKCNLCGSLKFSLYRGRLRDGNSKIKVFRCLRCAHIQLLPRPKAEEEREYYGRNKQDRDAGKKIEYGLLKANNNYDTLRHLRLFKGLCRDKKARILDIGAGYGFFVEALYRNGYRRVTGLEMSAQRSMMAKIHSRAGILSLDINSFSGERLGKFKAITLFHVLEHDSDPVSLLSNIRGLLCSGGLLICEVPNVKELLIEQCREYDDFYWMRAHLNYFSVKTLLSCFRKAGYSKVKISCRQRYGLINLCQWLASGKPQIARPVFEISPGYKTVEDFYRKYLASRGRSDTLIAVARV